MPTTHPSRKIGDCSPSWLASHPQRGSDRPRRSPHPTPSVYRALYLCHARTLEPAVRVDAKTPGQTDPRRPHDLQHLSPESAYQPYISLLIPLEGILNRIVSIVYSTAYSVPTASRS